MENKKFDAQDSIFNGLNGYRGVESFLLDLRDVLIKHNVKHIQSDFMRLTDEDVLVVRNSEFVGKKQVESKPENRLIEGTNIHYIDAVSNKYRTAFENANKEIQKYKKLADALKDVLEID